MTDPIYCSPLEMFCQPLDWWSSAASWAQAILSALAIYWAARIAMQQHRRDLYQRVSVIYQLVNVATATAAVNTAHVHRCAEDGRRFETDIEYFTLLTEALKAVPLHDLPDEGMTHVVAGSAQKSGDIGKLFQYLDSMGKQSYPPTGGYPERCAEIVQALWNYSLQARRLHVDYYRKLVFFGMPGYWQWRKMKRALKDAPTYPHVEIK